MEIPVSFSYLDVFSTFASLMGSNQADYKVALGAKFALPLLGGKTWNFEHEGNFPLLRVPSFSFAGISVKNLSLTSIDIDIAWEVENNNSFAMNVKDLSFGLVVNNSQWANGKVSGVPQIAANRKTRIPLTFSINSISMVRDITEIITRGTDANYTCTGNLILGMALPGLNDYTAPFNFSGATRLRN